MDLQALAKTPVTKVSSSTAPAVRLPEPLSPSTAPLACWLMLQATVLMLAASGVPLAARYPEPAERMTAHLVFGAQVVAAALLFPFLLRDLRIAVQVIATALPFQLAAGFLAGCAPSAIAWASILVAAWLATLAMYAALLSGPRTRATGVVAASLLTLGCGALHYLRREFPTDHHTGVLTVENVSPLLSTFASLADGTAHGWIPASALAFGAVAVATWQHFARRGHLRH